ncbi:MAG: hypothetical protein VX921_03805 [Chloroflexota bacterium]|nr:hypothetical protein [Chloroflexota bacterium]
MSTQSESPDQEVVLTNESAADTIEGIDTSLTSLQYHHLSLLQRLIVLQNSYQVDAEFENWKMEAINKAIYSTLRDAIEENVGEEAKELLRKST